MRNCVLSNPGLFNAIIEKKTENEKIPFSFRISLTTDFNVNVTSFLLYTEFCTDTPKNLAI